MFKQKGEIYEKDAWIYRPNQLGFLISAAIAGGAMLSEKQSANDVQFEAVPTERVQQGATKAASVDFPLH